MHHHRGELVLGRTSNGSLTLEEDAKGLRFGLDLPATSLGNDIAELVRRRDIAGMSFGFVVRDEDGEDWTERNGRVVRTLLDLVLIEISTTANPAYRGTSVSMARRFTSAAAAQAAERMRARLAQAGASA